MAWRAPLSKNLKELRVLFCQTSPASAEARNFVEKNYKELKSLNPKLPILIRECCGVEPQLWARYDFGVERGVGLDGMSEAQISKALEDLVKSWECIALAIFFLCSPISFSFIYGSAGRSKGIHRAQSESFLAYFMNHEAC